MIRASGILVYFHFVNKLLYNNTVEQGIAKFQRTSDEMIFGHEITLAGSGKGMVASHFKEQNMNGSPTILFHLRQSYQQFVRR